MQISKFLTLLLLALLAALLFIWFSMIFDIEKVAAPVMKISWEISDGLYKHLADFRLPEVTDIFLSKGKKQ